MISVIFSVCTLYSHPCQTRTLSFVDAAQSPEHGISLLQCQIYAGQRAVVEWVASKHNPDLYIKGWRCEQAGKVANI